jgi:hypothetical protein
VNIEKKGRYPILKFEVLAGKTFMYSNNIAFAAIKQPRSAAFKNYYATARLYLSGVTNIAALRSRVF